MTLLRLLARHLNAYKRGRSLLRSIITILLYRQTIAHMHMTKTSSLRIQPLRLFEPELT
jgi:hypothetical protein